MFLTTYTQPCANESSAQKEAHQQRFRPPSAAVQALHCKPCELQKVMAHLQFAKLSTPAPTATLNHEHLLVGFVGLEEYRKRHQLSARSLHKSPNASMTMQEANPFS